jgi:uncharacterized protein
MSEAQAASRGTLGAGPLPGATGGGRPVERPHGGLDPVVTACLGAAVLLGVLALRATGALGSPAVQAWSTVLLAITLQAVPFLVLGVLVSGVLAAFVPAGAFTALLPRRQVLAVPVAGLAGAVLPGCECSSVPVAGRLIDRGVPAAAALTFLLAAPAINPVVVIATVVAFPGQPEVAAARFLASLLAATAVGLVWTRWRTPVQPRSSSPAVVVRGQRFSVLRATAAHDFLHAGGYLVLGAALAATLQVVVPRTVVDSVAGHALLSIGALAVLAVVLSICSEADAFVAAGLSQFSLTARLVFLTVGPMVDLKLVALQIGTFGRAFAVRFAPLAFCCAVGSALLVSAVLL